MQIFLWFLNLKYNLKKKYSTAYLVVKAFNNKKNTQYYYII